MNSLVSQIIVDVLNREMAMPENSVWVRNQNRLIPNDNGLYIVVGLNNAIPLSNVTNMEQEQNGLVTIIHQISQVQLQENIQIDILSRSNDALLRNWEIIAAMQSFYCQQQQELNNFKIFRLPRSFIDASESEGGSTLNRYSITVPAMVWYRKDTLLDSPLGDFYDDFKQRVDDENTIGTDTPLIEFEINSEGIVP